ncbi:MAG TPA: hypothetical protein VF592_10420 [Sphingomonas sp.]|jgi:hypothetical protein|uniref:hypothetical protein n=1 Tax=Sphingomonas sp. TaxID=28214 RepID=UPI002EDAAF80
MDQSSHPLIADEMLDEQLAADDAEEAEDPRVVPYSPDPQTLWGLELARGMMVVLTRRFGPDFAREVSDELSSRALAYQAGCPDDRRDGNELQGLVCDRFWDELFAGDTPPEGKA